VIVSIHQPAYLPWLGYFDRIAKSDLFIVLDNVQFERNSFINRNKIKTANGPIWLTIPVRLDRHFDKTIAETAIDATKNWQKKHLRSIEQSYARAAGFPAKFERLQVVYEGEAVSLSAFCIRQLRFWLNELGITTPTRSASELDAGGRKSEMILALCKRAGASTYLSGPFGRDYLDLAEFKRAGVEVQFHDFKHPIYPQLHGSFLPGMGVVDYWMNAEAPDFNFTRAKELSA